MVVMGVLLAGSVVMNLRQLWRGREVGVEEKTEEKREEKKPEVKVAMPEMDFTGTGFEDGVWRLEGPELPAGPGEGAERPRGEGELAVPELVPGGREE